MPAHRASLASSLAAAALGVASVGASCRPLGEPPTMAERLEKVAQAVGTPPAGDARYLRYAVEGTDGAWLHEIVVGPSMYSERRTRRRDGERYAFGQDEGGSWLQAGGGQPVAVGVSWSELARSRGALHGLRFARPRPGDEAEYVGRSGRSWELAFRPEGGRTMTLTIDRPTGAVRAFDLVDDFGRLDRCDGLRWVREGGVAALGAATCGSASGGRQSHTVGSHLELEAGETLPPARVPRWARAAQRLAQDAPPRDAQGFRIDDPRRVLVPIRGAAGPAVPVVLDSGAFHTVLSPRAARALGVVPTGEPLMHIEPPWLRESDLWIGVVDRLRIGELELRGPRVLVAAEPRMLGGDAGLLGADLLERFVVDVDSPAGVVRIARRDGWEPDAGATLVRVSTATGMLVEGEVVGVAKGPIQIDTGMAEDIVVHAIAMATKHPRRRGDDAFLGGDADTTQSPDYWSEIAGLRVGPFSLPAMDAIGRDRRREAVGLGTIAVTGMGVWRYFRVAFAPRLATLYVWPGDAYWTLRRGGLDIEDGARGPSVDRVVARGPAERAGLRAGDHVLAVAGRPVASVAEARRALGRHPISGVAVAVERRGRRKTFVVDLANVD